MRNQDAICYAAAVISWTLLGVAGLMAWATRERAPTVVVDAGVSVCCVVRDGWSCAHVCPIDDGRVDCLWVHGTCEVER